MIIRPMQPGDLPAGLKLSQAAQWSHCGLLEGPQYTRPEEFRGMRVPEVLLSGDHARIARWRRAQALWRTWRRRPDLIETADLTATEQELIEQFRRGKGPDDVWMRSA